MLSVKAQDEILVMGKVISTVDDEPLSGVEIYVFKTVGAGRYEYDRAMTMYENGKRVTDYAEDWCMKRNKKCPTGGKTDGGICKYL